jgi:hypothetical protein
MEELAQIRHIIWKRALAQQGGMEMPASVMAGMEARGQDVQSLQDGRVTPDMLDGKYKFKPRGSVETADNGRLRADFVQMVQMLPALLQTNPMIAAAWQTPAAAKALNEQIVKLFRFPDRQAILGVPGQMAGQTQQMLADPAVQRALQGAGGAIVNGAPVGGAPMAGAPGPPQPSSQGDGFAGVM